MTIPNDLGADASADTDRAGDSPICLRVSRAMAMLDIGKTKLYELVGTGDLEAIRIGRRTLILRSSIEALIDRLRERARNGRRNG
ncbi:MAG: helix-turn-helix domain-containing protein [Pseudomonadota bacterium]